MKYSLIKETCIKLLFQNLTLILIGVLLLTTSCNRLEILPLPSDKTGSSDNTACEISKTDREWVNRSINAWHETRKTITELGDIKEFQAIFFNANCVLLSHDSMTIQSDTDVIWNTSSHDGAVKLPDGSHLPIMVTSFTEVNDKAAYFVMSLPSVWQENGVESEGLGLETLMTAVLLHEATHVVQIPTYGEQITDLSIRNNLPDTFNDDSIQERFQADRLFAQSIERETNLLFQAATTHADNDAYRMASEALRLMRARHERWFVGDDSYFKEAEALWLTLEGSGQWAGYRWLISNNAAALSESAVLSEFGKRSDWWTQKQGLALILTIDRLGEGWKQEIYRRGEITVIQMLEKILNAN